jgi:hypothetical protein
MVEPFLEQLGDISTVGKFDKDKSTVAHFARDPWENFIVLRQVFVEGLATPIY